MVSGKIGEFATNVVVSDIGIETLSSTQRMGASFVTMLLLKRLPPVPDYVTRNLIALGEIGKRGDVVRPGAAKASECVVVILS